MMARKSAGEAEGEERRDAAKAASKVRKALKEFPGAGVWTTTGELRAHLESAAGCREELTGDTLALLLKRGVLEENGDAGWRLAKGLMPLFGTVVGGRRGRCRVLLAEDGGERLANAETNDVAVLPGDRVRGALRGRHEEFEILRVEARRTKTLVCRAAGEHWSGDGVIAKPVDPYASASVLVAGAGSEDLTDKIFTVELAPLDEQHAPDVIMGSFGRVLGRASEREGEIAAAVERFGIPSVFSAGAMEEAAALPDEVPAEEAAGRVDLRDIALVTIDGEDARDFDDAVWCTSWGDGWRLIVAIADVSRYVTPSSALDRDAQERLTSVYFPRCVVPMLPEKLSNGLCSLNPGVDRAALVCDMVIGRDGIVSAYQFYPALIRSHARLTYTEVWNALNGDSEALLADGGSVGDIRLLHGLYKALREARAKRRAIDFETAEPLVEFAADGSPSGVKRRDHNDAHRLIEECMLAANTSAADFITRRGVKGLFRVHGAPAADRLASLRGMLSGFGLTLGGGAKPSAADFNAVLEGVRGRPLEDTVQSALLRSMQRAVYSPDPAPHFGLNYPLYTHFTSPIRRYPDLLVHRAIKAVLGGGAYEPAVAADYGELMASHAGAVSSDRAPAGASGGAWGTLAAASSAAERRADEASRDVVAWLKCVLMEKAGGRSFSGVVTGVNKAGVYVTLDEPFVDGFLHVSWFGDDYYEYDEQSSCFRGVDSGVVVRLGMKIRVGVLSVDAEEREISFCAFLRQGQRGIRRNF